MTEPLPVVIKDKASPNAVHPLLSNPSAFVATIVRQQAELAQNPAAQQAQRQAAEQAIDFMKKAVSEVQKIDKTMNGPQKKRKKTDEPANSVEYIDWEGLFTFVVMLFEAPIPVANLQQPATIREAATALNEQVKACTSRLAMLNGPTKQVLAALVAHIASPTSALALTTPPAATTTTTTVTTAPPLPPQAAAATATTTTTVTTAVT